MFDICVVGHITKDIVKTTGGEIVMPGGSAYYTSVALKKLGVKVAVITKLCRRDASLLSELENQQIPVFQGESDRTTAFKNVYSRGADSLEQWAKDIAAPFTIRDASRCDARHYHLGPLTRWDIPLDVIRFLAREAKISLDVQGFVRDVPAGRRGWARVRHEAWKEKRKALSYVDILKANEVEAKMLSHEREPEKIAEELSGHGPGEVVITLGSNPSLVYAKGRTCWTPAYPPRNAVAIDPTGCGDTYMAGYLFYRERTRKLEEVARFAAITASLKLERGRAFSGTKEEVREFAKAIGQPLK